MPVETGKHRLDNKRKEIIISIGCNTKCEQQMARARKRLTEAFPGAVFTEAITTPDCTLPANPLPYSNCLASFTTKMPEHELNTRLKEIERELGDTAEQRWQGTVMMDVDILQYNGEHRHETDWERPYVKTLMPLLRRILIIILISLCVSPVTARTNTKDTDTELLGKAVEYYQGGKYHECILAFERLQQRYKLNPRFKAYLGMSYFKEARYEEAAENLKEGIPELTAYSPKEQAVYIYSCAESLFRLECYEEAITFYSMALPITEGNDKGDVLFHTAFSLYLLQDFHASIPLFQQAAELYRLHTKQGDDLHTARLRQTETMLRGLRKLYPPEPDEMPEKSKSKEKKHAP